MKNIPAQLVLMFAIPYLMSTGQEIQEKSKDESKLSIWYNRVKDPSFECPPIIHEEHQDEAGVNYKSSRVF